MHRSSAATPPTARHFHSVLSLPVLVAALGYFVDIYDLILFSIVRVPSLKSLGLAGQALVDQGVFLLNMQMAGMLAGGILWGILGDKKGRMKIMFGSIFLYSLANFANGVVHSVDAYAAARFIAGVGLAGELGAGITLVSEMLHQELRGYGTMIVSSVGVTGAIAANYVAGLSSWRLAFYIGGILGFVLLVLRICVHESGMFREMATTGVSRGNFFSLFTDRGRFGKYLNSILIGIPIWFVVGILITFSPEFGKALGVAGPVKAGNAVMFCYIGLIFGGVASGVMSQLMKSRKKVVFSFILLTVAGIAAYFCLLGASPAAFYAVCAFLGLGGGYWAVFVTIAAEQFGTNLRATVATTVPNFVRGMVVPITLLFQFACRQFTIETSAILVGAGCVLVSLFALWHLEETYHKELDYYEQCP
ncbi:MAG TPA: MFS transporter [Geobacteraceae bacterium]